MSQDPSDESSPSRAQEILEHWGLDPSDRDSGRPGWSVDELARGILQRWWLVALTTILGCTGLAVYSMTLPVRYTATATIEILRTPPVVMPLRDVMSTSVTSHEDLYTQLLWLSSAAIAQRVANRLTAAEQVEVVKDEPRNDGPIPPTASILLRDRRADPVRVSLLLAVSYRHGDPALAARIANLFAEEFIASRTEHHTAGAVRATKELAAKVGQQRQLVAGLALQLQEFKEEHDVASLDARRDIASTRLREINSRVSQRTARLAETANRCLLLREATAADRSLADISAVAQAPQIEELQREIAHRRIALAQLQNRYRAKHPRMLEAEAGRAAMESTLVRAITDAVAQAENEHLLAQRALEQERTALATLEDESFRLQRLAIGYENISRDLGAADSLFKSILIRLHETSLVSAIKSEPARILDRALAPDFLAARRHLIRIALGAAAGCAAGLGFAVMLGIIDGRIASSAALEAASGLPVLAELGALQRKPRRRLLPALVTTAHEARVFESLRDLYCVLRTATARTQTRVVLITSAGRHEGKSFVAVNLAQMCAAHDERTLVIDADPHHPRLHECFPAISLRPSEASSPETVSAVAVGDRLDLVSAASLPKTAETTPWEQRLKTVLDDCATRYDRVIIDAPPIASSTTTMLTARADACLLVARYRRTRQAHLTAAVERARDDGAALLGVVFNALPARKTARKFRPEHQEGWDRPEAEATAI